MAAQPEAEDGMRLDRPIFNRDAYERYRLVVEKLLKAGHEQIDIVMQLDEAVKRAANPSQAGYVVSVPGDERSVARCAVKFFDYVLTCKVTRSKSNRLLVRIVDIVGA
jgi:hypothetical protein